MYEILKCIRILASSKKTFAFMTIAALNSNFLSHPEAAPHVADSWVAISSGGPCLRPPCLPW